jgi:hypothetical protein
VARSNVSCDSGTVVLFRPANDLSYLPLPGNLRLRVRVCVPQPPQPVVDAAPAEAGAASAVSTAASAVSAAPSAAATPPVAAPSSEASAATDALHAYKVQESLQEERLKAQTEVGDCNPSSPTHPPQPPISSPQPSRRACRSPFLVVAATRCAQMLPKRKLEELVKQIDPNQELDHEVEEVRGCCVVRCSVVGVASCGASSDVELCNPPVPTPHHVPCTAIAPDHTRSCSWIWRMTSSRG